MLQLNSTYYDYRKIQISEIGNDLMADLAIQILNIPYSEAAVERLFALLNNIYTKKDKENQMLSLKFNHAIF